MELCFRIQRRKAKLCCWIFVWLIGALTLSVPCAAEPLRRSILVLEQSGLRGPFNAAIFSALRSQVGAARPPVSIDVENLDLSRFSGAEYEQSLRNLFLIKYRDKKIGVIVALGGEALGYAIRWRSELWPDAPIVFGFVSEGAVAKFLLPDDVTGTTTRQTLADMISAARASVNDLKHIALVGDRFETNPAFKHFANEVANVPADLDVIDLTGLPMQELRRRVGVLPDASAILYTAVYSDGAGNYFPPAHGVAMIAETANRPIIAAAETYIERGALGGYVLIPAVIGEEAAQQALQIIDGQKPSGIPIAVGTSLRPVFDWHEMQRWGVGESKLPAGSEIRNRVLPLWEEYPRQAAAMAAVVLLQTAFIALLLYEHRRRGLAEVEARMRMNELAHMNRRSTAGELSTSIAHEVNQPLGAILSNVYSAELILESPTPDFAEIKDIVSDIKRDNVRASKIISRLRGLLKKETFDSQEIDLNDTVREVLEFVSMEASACDVSLRKSLALEPLRVRGDPIHLQQVVMNLVMNGIEALRDVKQTPRRITCRTRRVDETTAGLSISDTGPPLSPETLARMFDPFFTTKENGMGMGLAIARTIIETHGGSIHADCEPGSGAIFRIQLPLAQTSRG